MTAPLFRFRQAGNGYTVADAETGASLGTVDRLSQDFQTLSPKWRAIAPDGATVGSHYRARRDAAVALADRATELAAELRHAAFHARSDLPRPSVLCTRCTPQTRIEPGRGLVADVEPVRVFQDPTTGTHWRADGQPGHTCPGCGNGYATEQTAAPDGHDCTSGPMPGSFHDPRVSCCDRDAADCDCDTCGTCGQPASEVADHVVDGVIYHEGCIPPEKKCERCGDPFDPAEAGTDEDAGLCAGCTANNDARVVL